MSYLENTENLHCFRVPLLKFTIGLYVLLLEVQGLPS